MEACKIQFEGILFRNRLWSKPEMTILILHVTRVIPRTSTGHFVLKSAIGNILDNLTFAINL